MKLESMEKAEGFLTIKKRYSDGSEELVLDNDPNVITIPSRRHHLSFLYDENTPRDLLNSFKVGKGGTIDPEGKRPIVPDPNKTGLYTDLSGTVNDTIDIIPSDPADNSQVYIKVVFSVNQDEANGEDISECALFKKSGAMFNLKTFKAIEKTESFALIFEWKIRYV